MNDKEFNLIVGIIMGSALPSKEKQELIGFIRKIEKKVNSNGWIPCSERLPETDKYILLSFSNFSVPCVGRYETDDENGGAFYIGDEAESCSEQDMFVNAWMPLPEPYREETEDE